MATELRSSAFRRATSRARVLLFGALLAGAGAALLFVTPGWASSPERVWSLPLLALAVAFGITEAAALHVEIRKESHSLSLASIPLMVGLLYASPAHVLMAYILGASSTLLWIRKSDVLKVVWNTCLFVAQVGLAGFILRIAIGDRLPETPMEWLVPLGAVIAAELLSLFAVPMVIMAVDATFRSRGVSRPLA